VVLCDQQLLIVAIFFILALLNLCRLWQMMLMAFLLQAPICLQMTVHTSHFLFRIMTETFVVNLFVIQMTWMCRLTLMRLLTITRFSSSLKCVPTSSLHLLDDLRPALINLLFCVTPSVVPCGRDTLLTYSNSRELDAGDTTRLTHVKQVPACSGIIHQLSFSDNGQQITDFRFWLPLVII